MVRKSPARPGRHPSRRSRRGFVLLEAILGVALISLFSNVIIASYFESSRSTIYYGNSVQALALSRQALGGIQSMRDDNFDALLPGLDGQQHGVAIDSLTSKWAFSGSSVTSSGGYVTNVILQEVAGDWIRATATTRWSLGVTGSGSVSLDREVTDWRRRQDLGDWSVVNLVGSATPGGSPLFTGIVSICDFAFLGSEGNDHLYVYDIIDPASPVRVASTFSLPFPVRALALLGTKLYILSDDPSAELSVYDVADPGGLSSASLLSAIDLPVASDAVGLALDVQDGLLLVGTSMSALQGNAKLFVLSLATPGTPALQGQTTVDGDIADITGSGGIVFLATSNDAAEIVGVSIANPSSPVVTSDGCDLDDVYDGSAIAERGATLYAGRAAGGTIDEISALDLRSVDMCTTGVRHHEVGSKALSIELDTAGCYAFIGNSNGLAQVQILESWTPGLDLATSINVGAAARTLHYAGTRDLLLVGTDQSLRIYEPSSSPSTCSL